MACLASTGVTYETTPGIVAPCYRAYSILVQEPGKTSKTVSITSVKTKITDKLDMSYLHIEYDHESNTPVFKLTNIVTPPPATNLPPVISGVSGPTTLKINEAGTFSVNAYDPENKTLYYLIKWGDEPKYFALDYQGAVAETTVTTQKSSYTHSYAKSGTYTINIEVSDDWGNTAKSSLTVKVADGVVNVLKVTSPNGGEVLYSGTNSTISWQGASDYVNVYLVRDYNYNCDYNYYYPCVMPMAETETMTTSAMYYQPDILLFSHLPSMTNNSVNWVVGTGSTYDYYDYYGGYQHVGDGNYKIKVCTTTNNVCDSSDSSFRITSTYYPRG
jgi:hypothetical protein